MRFSWRIIAVLAFMQGCAVEEPPRTLGWSIAGEIGTRPLIVGDTVFAAFYSGRIVAADAESGALAWERFLPSEINGSSLVVVDSTLVIPAAALHGLNRGTGTVRWSYVGATGATGFSSPAASGDTLFVADRGGFASAINAHTGAEYWRVELGEDLFAPTLAGDIVLFGGRSQSDLGVLGEGHLFALDRATGAERWRRLIPDDPAAPFSGGVVSGGAVWGSRVFVGSANANVYALDVATGDSVWQFDGGTPRTDSFAWRPVVIGGRVVFLRDNGLLIAFDQLTGDISWTTDLTDGGTTLAAPVRCGAYICIGSGRLWVVDEFGVVRSAFGGGIDGIVFLNPPAVSSSGVVAAAFVKDQQALLGRLLLPFEVPSNP